MPYQWGHLTNNYPHTHWCQSVSLRINQVIKYYSYLFAGFQKSKLNLTLPFEPLGSRPFIPLTNPFILPADAGTCNLGMPNGPTVFDRYIWVIKFLTRNGFVVVADNHLVNDPTAVNNATFWVQVRGLFPLDIITWVVNLINLYWNMWLAFASHLTKVLEHILSWNI